MELKQLELENQGQSVSSPPKKKRLLCFDIDGDSEIIPGRNVNWIFGNISYTITAK